MTFLIGFLTFILVLNCLFLMLLVLIQLPKKEAGAGVAFGAGATDALFGAGSGNALTKMTKYAATVFVLLSLSLAYMNAHRAKESTRGLEQELLKKANTPANVPPPTAANNLLTPVVATNLATTNTLQLQSTTPATQTQAVVTPAPATTTPPQSAPAAATDGTTTPPAATPAPPK